MPFFKKSAVGKATSGDPTLLVDLKAAGGGYVICAGSRTDQGAYEPVSAPADGKVPMLTQPMLELFSEYGFIRLPEAYMGPDGKPHVGHGDARPTVAPERVRAVQVIRRPPASGHIAHGAPHAPQRAGAPRQVRGGREPGHESAGVGGDGAFDTLRALAGDHDPSDTERVLRDMANGYGCKYFEPRND